MPTVQVLYFAVLRERRGVQAESVEVPDGSTLQQVYEQIFPPTAEGILPVGFARNQVHARGTDVICDGDEIALLPPLGGG